jgi:inosine-uridine nucleoside N-ribohydrolase
MLLGHGPVFQDFNFVQDPAAVAELMALRLPMTLIPYEAGSEIVVTEPDLDAMRRAEAGARWVAERSREWLAFWREDIGQQGFFPFDLVAAAYLLHPELFRCAEVSATIEPHSWFWRWRLGTSGLFVDQTPAGGDELGDGTVYCPSLGAGGHDAALAAVAHASPGASAR